MEVDDDYYGDDVSVESDASSDYEPENAKVGCALCQMRVREREREREAKITL